MGQTLSHGVYLPNEGERNCYAGLASNWQILNTAVGAIAEKAPLVHTHGNITNDGKVGTAANKPLITGTGGAVQAGSFGNQANTFCEGNDSRLSDARTPVAHTHTKSDVTDLLNSDFIPSANNAYDLGSSSYQWNNLYAKNYYYNGVAWGLDKANVYSLEQTISATSGKSWNVKNTNYTLGENTPSSDKLVGAFAVQDNGNNNAFLFNLNHYSNGEVISRWLTRFKFTDGVKSTTGTQKAAVIEMGLTNSGDRFARPGTNGDMDLGTSSFKWKTLNGINPGALSLPKTENGRYSLTELSSISGIGVDNWVLNGEKIVIAAEYVITGWLYVCIACDTDGYVILQTGGYSYPNCFYKVTGTPIAGYASAMIPIVEGIALALYLKGTSLIHARYYPAAGNV